VLIFVVITLFTGFPGAFGALSRALVAPVSVALLGIVLRGAAFVFRQYGAPDGGAPVAGHGAVGAGVRGVLAGHAVRVRYGGRGAGGGTLRADGSAGLWRPYLAPLPLLAGLLAVVCCAYLARCTSAATPSDRLARPGSPGSAGARWAPVCWRRAGAGRPAAAAAALGGELRGVGLPAVLVSASGGVLGLVLLWRRRHGLARIAAACAPVGLLAGWGLGLYPWVLPGQMLLAESAAPPVIAGPVLIVLLTGLAIVAPATSFMLRILRARPD